MFSTRPLCAAVLLAVFACSASSSVSRELGALCDDADECEERCLEGARYPGGFCSLSCDDETDCPDGASCVARDGGVCLFGCADDDGCDFLGGGWRCRPTPERGGGSGDEVLVCVGSG